MVSRTKYALPLPDGRVLEFGARTCVMGVLNLSPDSFAEPTRVLDPAQATDAALDMQAAGADIIDIGGESTRPGAEPVEAREELRRVLPVIKALARQLQVPLSVDTYKADVARAVLDEGAVIINDVSGLEYDPNLAGVLAARGAAVVLMHNRGRSLDMYRQAHYQSVVSEVVAELDQTMSRAVDAGIWRDRIVLDPGLGFAKQAEHTYQVLAHLPALSVLGRPILIGPSRKSFLRMALGEGPAVERDWGTAAAVTAAVLGGAHAVRVHRVREMIQVARVADMLVAHGDGRSDGRNGAFRLQGARKLLREADR